MKPRADLASRTCEPCRSGATPLEGSEISDLLAQIDDGWEVVDEHHLRRTFKFKNFVEALSFTNRVGGLAEEQFHHPDIHLGWGRVVLEIWTHKVGGLLEADFIFAAKCEQLYASA